MRDDRERSRRQGGRIGGERSVRFECGTRICSGKDLYLRLSVERVFGVFFLQEGEMTSSDCKGLRVVVSDSQRLLTIGIAIFVF